MTRSPPVDDSQAEALTAAIGALDLADVSKLALVQLALGGAGVVFSLAALAARR